MFRGWRNERTRVVRCLRALDGTIRSASGYAGRDGVCARTVRAHRDPTPPPSSSPAAVLDAGSIAASLPDAETSAPLTPLGGEWVERTVLPSGAIFFFTRPLGATGTLAPRAHCDSRSGGSGRTRACSEWHATTAGYLWVLCPQGTPLRTAYAWGSAEQIATLAFESRAAIRARYPAYVAEGPLLYGGFSQGASLASSVVAAHPGDFDRVVMVEAGHTPLSAPAVIYGLHKGEVGRAILSCSTQGCASFASALVAAAHSRGFDLAINDAGRRGHVFDGPVMQTLGDKMISLVAGDPRYAGFAAAIAARVRAPVTNASSAIRPTRAGTFARTSRASVRLPRYSVQPPATCS